MEDQIWDNISEDAKDLVRRMITIDPKKRLGPRSCLQHKFINKAYPVERRHSLPTVGRSLLDPNALSQFAPAFDTQLTPVRIGEKIISVAEDNRIIISMPNVLQYSEDAGRDTPIEINLGLKENEILS